MNELLSYIKSRNQIIAVFAIIAGIFASSYLLFDMPAITVLYPLGLTVGVLIVAGVIDFVRFCGSHRKLKMASGDNTISLADMEFPAPKDTIESDYQAIINTLMEEEKKYRHRACSDYNNMVEYYTVWAHQIKTPIAAMRLNLQSEDSELARQLSGDLNRIEAYVEMVLTFLRLDSDSTDYVIKDYNLDDIIRPAIRKFSREFILKKLSLDFKTTDYHVLTDDKWLSFIIEQIISNAVKYTSKGGIRIYMDEPGILCIEDTGIGITAEDLPRIFENGYTGFNGREDKRASGIGLYLCRRIADNLDITLTAQSEPGVGTTMMLDLRIGGITIE